MNWVFKSVLVENGVSHKQMEEFMYELMTHNVIITKDEIKEKMEVSNILINGDIEVESFIDHLVNLTIIGRETENMVFTYEYDVNNAKKIKVLGQKFNSNRFEIHKALVPYLECKV